MNVKDDAAVQRWLSCYPGADNQPRLCSLTSWLKWLRRREGFESVTPSDLITMQEEAERKQRYQLLDLLQMYLREKDATYKYNCSIHSYIRSFFSKNRVALPDDRGFIIPATREPNVGRLSLEHIKLFVNKAPYHRAPFYLTLWMGLMDQKSFQYFNLKYAARLVEHLRSQGPDQPFMIEFPGRKQSRMREKFYTFIGKDALLAWKLFFDKVRGWPMEGEPILFTEDGRPMTKKGLTQWHLRFCTRLRLHDCGGGLHNRYGFNLHEFRDVAKTLLHLEGVKDGLDMEAVDFWMGHIPDRNRYDKFYLDKSYMLEQYRIAANYLNILSAPSAAGAQIKNVDEVIDQIVKNKPAFEKLLVALETRMGSKLAPKD